VDAETHVHYVRLLLSQPGIADSTSAPPRLTFECLENAGKLDFKWYVSFGGIKTIASCRRSTQPREFPTTWARRMWISI